MVQWICTKFGDSKSVIQIHQGVCVFNYVQRDAGLHLSEPNV